MQHEKTQEELRAQALRFKAGMLGLTLEELAELINLEVKGPFKPVAFYTPGLRDVRVVRKDCSYTAKRVSRWSDVLLDTHCPRWKPWGRYIGFEVYYPWVPQCMEIISARVVLDRVLQEDPKAFGWYKPLYYWLARGLDVKIYKEEK